MQQTFKHWQIAPDTYAIQCPGYLPGPGRLPGWGYVICYLIVGREKAILLDTGYGNADLKAEVESLTDKPVLCLNSHVHPDHSGGNQQFGTVYILEGERETIAPMYFPQPPERERCDMVKALPDYRFAFLPEGSVLDLGGRSVEVPRLEGHTPGSMVLIDSQTRFLFSGDAILKRVLLMAGQPLSQYRAALERTKAHGGFVDIYGAHWYEPLGADYIDKVLALIDDFSPEGCESAPWMEANNMMMFCHGNAFEEKDFAAIGFGEKDMALMLR